MVFDIGANDGRTVIPLRQLLPSTPIYAFEPVEETYRQLVQRTKHLNDVHCFHIGIGSEIGRKTIYLNEISALNSFSPDWGASIGNETVAVSTIDQVMLEQGIDFIHFLKIDTEGYELEVLKGAQNALGMSKIGILQLELGFGQVKDGLVSLEEIRCHLAPKGYYLYGIYNQCRTKAYPPAGWDSGKSDGYSPKVLVYCDAVFISAKL